MIVRRGFGNTCFRIRIASIITTVPVPLSVAPDEPSHESKCADSSTYSFGSSLPGIAAMVFATGAVPSDSASACSRSTGPC